MGDSSKVNKLDQHRIIKVYKDNCYGIFFRELAALKRLNKVDTTHFPKLLSYDDKANGHIVLEYCGNPVSLSTIPRDYDKQIRDISRILDMCGIKHLDVTRNNLLVHNNLLKLIDFGHVDVLDQGFTVDEQQADEDRAVGDFVFQPGYFFECDYLEQEPDLTYFILHNSVYLRSLPTPCLRVRRNAVYKYNLAQIRHLIGNL